MNDAVGLYVHIPFCLQKCGYCDFYSLADTAQKSAYIQALCRQIRAAACASVVVDTVYFGGGTPSLLTEAQLCACMEAIRAFPLSPDAEISMEVNPATADEAAFGAFRACGVNRVSVGMQSASDRELSLLGRVHAYADVQQCVRDLTLAGFENFSLDLMYGIPGQREQDWEESLLAALSLAPAHLSLYALSLSENVPLYALRDRLPAEDTQARFYEIACALLLKNGYAHYEISNFAKPGACCRHNLKYWKRQPYLGFGPAASSLLDERRYDAPPDLNGFLAQDTPLLERIAAQPRLSERERLAETLMLSLRLSEGLLTQAFCGALSPAERDAFMREADRLCAQGLACRRGESFCLSEAGFFVSNEIIARLLLCAGL